eukprot:evm.model.NODE_21050_length_7120_cov_19.655758.1
MTQEKRVSEAMCPRVDVEALDKRSSLQQLQELFQRTRYSRIPVFDGEIDKIIGVAMSKDLLEYVFSKEQSNVLDLPVETAPSSGIIRSQIPEICRQLLPYNSNDTDLFLSRACPPALGCYSLGAAVYEINPSLKESNGMDKVTRQWTRTDRSCGTSIPLISGKAGSNAAYCVEASA